MSDSIAVFLHDIAYQATPEKFKEDYGVFLSQSEREGISFRIMSERKLEEYKENGRANLTKVLVDPLSSGHNLRIHILRGVV